MYIYRLYMKAEFYCIYCSREFRQPWQIVVPPRVTPSPFSTPVDPGDFVSTVGLTGINSAGMNIEAIPNKVVLCILVFRMATFCLYYCLASSLHRFNKTT